MDDSDDLRYLIFKQKPVGFTPKVAKFKVGKLRSEKEFENDRVRKRNKNAGFSNFETLQVASEESSIENALLVTFHNSVATGTQVSGNSVVNSDFYSISPGSFYEAQHMSYSDDAIDLSHGPNSARKEPVRELKRKYDRSESDKDLHRPFKTRNTLAGRIPLSRRRVSVKSDTGPHSEHNSVLDYIVSSESEIEKVVERSHDASRGIIKGMSSFGNSELPVCEDTNSVSVCASMVATFEKEPSPDRGAVGIKFPEKFGQNIEKAQKIKLNRRSILGSISDAERNPGGKINLYEQPQLRHGNERMLSIHSPKEATYVADDAKSAEELRRQERIKRFGVFDEKVLAKPDQSISSKPQSVTLATDIGSSIPRSEKRVGNVIRLDGIATEEHLQLKGNEVVKLSLSLQTDVGNGRLKKRTRSSPITIILEPSPPICESAALKFSSTVVQDNAITSSEAKTSEDYSGSRFHGSAEKFPEPRVAAESVCTLPDPSDCVKREVQSPGAVFATDGSVGAKDDGPIQMGLAERLLNREKSVKSSSDLVECDAVVLKPGSKRNAGKRHKSEARTGDSHGRVDGACAVVQADDSNSSEFLLVTAAGSVKKSDTMTNNVTKVVLFDSEIGQQTVGNAAILPVTTAVAAQSSTEITKAWASTSSGTPLGLSDAAVLDSKDLRAENPSLTNVPGPDRDEAVKNYVSKNSKGSGIKAANKNPDKGKVRSNNEQQRLKDDSKVKKKSQGFESSQTKDSVANKKHAVQSLSKKRRFSSSSESSFSTSGSSDSDSRSSSSYSSTSGSESDYETDSSSSGSSTDSSGSTSSTSSYSSGSDRKGKRSRKAKASALVRKSSASKSSKATFKTASARQKSATGHSRSSTLPDKGSRGKGSAGSADAHRKASVMPNRVKVEGKSAKIGSVDDRSLKESSKSSSQKNVDSLKQRSKSNNPGDERNGRSSKVFSSKAGSSHDSKGFRKSHSPAGKRSSTSSAPAKKLPHATSTRSHKS